MAVATFDTPTAELRFVSCVTLEHYEDPLPEYPLEDYAKTFPFRYPDDDLPNLARALANQHPGDLLRTLGQPVSSDRFRRHRHHSACSRVSRSTVGIRRDFRYVRRTLEKGVQTPQQTLESRCRKLP